jgi:hypothetical protein
MTLRTALAAIVITVAAGNAAHAQSRTIYNDSGKRVGRSVTDAQGNITFFDLRGKITGRMNASGDITTPPSSTTNWSK